MADFAKERDWDQFHSPRNLLLALKNTQSGPRKCEGQKTNSTATCQSKTIVGPTILAIPVGEVGELSEIFQWKGEVPRGLPGWEDGEKQHLGEELSDVLLYLVRLSDICGVDLGKAALRKMELNAIKYPVKLCKGSSKKHTQFNGDSGDNADKDQGH
ncbi:hypothetical protein GOBAR_AA16553 [Gossypium barbadense]|uniref:dCTP pyrophosphatase 1 n=1 Tax=Gossypium barbadense TaxID=3634 RepID=A0A2P5XLB8_GOSBA|nr:hypothetical protein GOBAR_AA16553 [Gossypium barbadense]